ncbi:MAG: LytTR family DNA-binding domain-containing protein [Defluviitaleaceae bacterium]|nr:LytTR family DNA-binding domain-containing protein [Defluviitaleaceae bacterium]MCL2263180.1 LytTR family DNA-binding domain-containing protein [Defluviitaleaceae bacterium]
MLNVFICEDNSQHRDEITQCVKNYITIEDLPMQIVCSTENPAEVLRLLKDNQASGIYFIDIYLENETDGIALAAAIREHDPRGFIVFITVDEGSYLLALRYKLEAMDYIVKGRDNLQTRIHECLQDAHKKYTGKCTPLQNNFVFAQSKDRVISIPCDHILYFTVTTPHNLIILTAAARHEFRYTLNDAQKRLPPNFIRCHRAYIVNTHKISALHKTILHMENGDTIAAAKKYIPKIKAAMKISQEIS